MDENVFNNLDKLILQLVFQLEQASSAKEYVRQQIQIYTANIVQRKSEICNLKEDINKDDEVIVSLHKCSSRNNENFKVWKHAYGILNKHEEYLEKELQTCEEITEKDKKMYNDYKNQYEEKFKQHQAKYLETAVAQEYYQEKKECDEIQNRVLKLSELLKQKEAEVMELQEPGPFQSISYWALQIASLRQNTKETLKNAAVLSQQSLELEKASEEIQKNINAFKQQRQRISDSKNHPEVTKEKSVNNPMAKKDFDESSFKESHQQRLLNEKHQKYKPLHLPSISHKLVQSVPTLKPLFQHTKTGAEEKNNPAEHSAVSSMYFSSVVNEMQKCNETAGSNNGKTLQVSSVPTLKNQTPFRLLTYQKQTNSEQWFEAEATEIVSEEKKIDSIREEGNKSKDSAFISQESETGCDFKTSEHNSEAGEKDAEHFPRTPKPNVFPKTPDFGVKLPSEFRLQTESGPVSKSAFSFLGFSTKSSGFNFFDSPEFGIENSPCQSTGSYSAGNINPSSPQKDIEVPESRQKLLCMTLLLMPVPLVTTRPPAQSLVATIMSDMRGDLFGKADTEDSFSFPFPSCSSGQAFQEGKDDFSFPFAFGSSQPPSLKGFPSTEGSSKSFSLF